MTGWNEPIEIETERYGTVLLRRFMDTDMLVMSQATSMTPREFAATAISKLTIQPDLTVEEVVAWDDDLLVEVVHAWTSQNTEVQWQLPEGTALFAPFQQQYQVYIKQLNEAIQEALAPSREMLNQLTQQYADMGQQIAKSIRDDMIALTQSFLAPLQENLNRMVESIQIEVGKLFPLLPDIVELIEYSDELGKTIDAIESSDFRVAILNWSLREIEDFKGIELIDDRVRNAVITNKMLALTRDSEFLPYMEKLFERSSVLKRRWRVVRAGLLAHQERNYILAIPTLLGQVEGLFADALVLKGIVEQDKDKFYAKDGTSGNLKLNKRGKPIQLHGLGQMVDNSDLQDDFILHGFAQFLTTFLVAERNDIQHGRNLDYDRAKLSAQLVLTIRLLAAEFAEFESEIH